MDGQKEDSFDDGKKDAVVPRVRDNCQRMIDRESQFLAARAQRQSQSKSRKQHGASRERAEELEVFWSFFRTAIGQWQNQLQDMLDAHEQIR